MQGSEIVMDVLHCNTAKHVHSYVDLQSWMSGSSDHITNAVATTSIRAEGAATIANADLSNERVGTESVGKPSIHINHHV